jgi:hypothetical protein
MTDCGRLGENWMGSDRLDDDDDDVEVEGE